MQGVAAAVLNNSCIQATWPPTVTKSFRNRINTFFDEKQRVLDKSSVALVTECTE
jgi:hypothetical protein